MLLGTLGANFLGSISRGKIILRAGYENKEEKGGIHKDIFACLFSIHNIIISLSCHEQVCLNGLRFERYFSL